MRSAVALPLDPARHAETRAAAGAFHLRADAESIVSLFFFPLFSACARVSVKVNAFIGLRH